MEREAMGDDDVLDKEPLSRENSEPSPANGSIPRKKETEGKELRIDEAAAEGTDVNEVSLFRLMAEVDEDDAEGLELLDELFVRVLWLRPLDDEDDDVSSSQEPVVPPRLTNERFCEPSPFKQSPGPLPTGPTGADA